MNPCLSDGKVQINRTELFREAYAFGKSIYETDRNLKEMDL